MDPAERVEPPNSTVEAAARGSKTHRPIYSFWSNGTGNATAGPSSDAGVTAKDKGARKRAKRGGEEAEMKEMAKKAKAAAKVQAKKDMNVSKGRGEQELPNGRDFEPRDHESIDASPSKSNLSPSRKKGGRPRKSSSAKLVNHLAEAEIVNLVSSDPPDHPDSSTSLIDGPLLRKSPRRKQMLKAPRELLRTMSTNSAASGSSKGAGAMDDPIDVDANLAALKPKKILFAADRDKPTHSFFSVKPVPVTIDLMTPSGISASKGKVKSKEGAAIPNGDDSEAQMQTQGETTGSAELPTSTWTGWGRAAKLGHEWPCPWPGNVFPTHTPGPSSLMGSYHEEYQLPRRRLVHATRDPGSHIPTLANRFWQELLSDWAKQQTNGHRLDHDRQDANGLPTYVAQHPAIRAVKSRKNTFSRQAFTGLYVPDSAAQVLGNEVEATYLRDWLSALSVGEYDELEEPRTVYRKVNRRNALLEGFIVDDIGLFGSEALKDDAVEYEDFEEPELEVGERPTSYPPLENRLANCMLLVGDHGTGKSAAVYAVAKELGWEVFEVYPGMGKRTAAGLMSWVGDVGKNHLVVRDGKTEDRSRSLASPTAEIERQAGLESFFKSYGLDDVSTPTKSPRGHKRQRSDVSRSGGFRQSLILIEEADILFYEETTFWPAVLSLIAESRRPVILTCNDANLLPIDSLPLQAVLYFHPPPSYLAIPYLECIASKEGIADTTYATSLYDRCTRAIAPTSSDRPLAPNGNEPLPRFDLRQALIQMQVERGRAVPDKVASSSKKLGDLAGLLERWDNRSFADSFVCPRPAHLLEVEEIDRYQPCGDDRLGISALPKPTMSDCHPGLAAYDKSSDIAEAILSIVGDNPQPNDLQTARVHYIRSLLPLLDPLIPLSSNLLPHSTLFLDVLPAIQAIVAVDDILEAEEDEAVRRGEGRWDRKTGKQKRDTRAGMGRGYERWINVDEKGLRVARESILDWD